MADSTRRSTVPTVWAVGLGASLVSAIALTVPSLWTDEGATVSAATRPVGELFRMAGTIDAVHTVYYLFMHGWIAVLGQSSLSLRGPSALAVGAAVAGTWLLAERLAGRTTAWWSAAVCLLLPRMAWAAVEARSYALVAAASVWATFALLSALRSHRRGWWALYAVLLGTAVFLHLDAALLVPAHGLTVLLAYRGRALLRWFLPAGIALLPTVPLVVIAAGQSGQVGTRDVGLMSLARNVMVNQWFLGETPSVYSRAGTVVLTSSGARVWQVAAVGLAVVCWALLAVHVLGRGRRAPGAASVLVWAVPWAVVPTMVLTAYGLVSHTYSPRYLTFTAPAIALLLGSALAALRPMALRSAVAVVMLVLALPVLVSQRAPNAKSGYDWSQVARAVSAGCRAGDWVYFAPRVAPEQGEPALLTTRGVSVAYPEAFDGLHDLTLLSTPVQSGDLVGRSRALSQVGDTLSQVDRLCVVERNDYAAAADDDALLSEAGLGVQETWVGPISTVQVRVRG